MVITTIDKIYDITIFTHQHINRNLMRVMTSNKLTPSQLEQYFSLAAWILKGLVDVPNHIKYTTVSNKVVHEKAILISVRAPVGAITIANREYCIGRGLAGLFIEDETSRDYIYNFLKYSKSELEKHSTGFTFKAVNKDTLAGLKCKIPSQRKLHENSSKLNDDYLYQEEWSEFIVTRIEKGALKKKIWKEYYNKKITLVIEEFN